MFALIAITLLVCANAFAPMARSVPRAASLQMADFKSEVGVQPPLGFWDPLGILEEADQQRFDRLRAVETKHGRIAMLAVLGHIVTTAGVRLPGEIAYGIPFSSVKVGLKGLETIPAAGIVQIVMFIGLLEMGFTSRKDEIEKVHLEKSKWNDATIKRKMAIELNNGRAAQMGILGLMVHEAIDGKPYVLNEILGAPVAFN